MIHKILTDRLILRPLKLTHADGLFPIFNDPTAMRYWHTPVHDTLTATQTYLQEELFLYFEKANTMPERGK